MFSLNSKKKQKKSSKLMRIICDASLILGTLLLAAAPKIVLAFDADGVAGAATAGLKDFFTFGTGLMLWVLGGLAALFITTNVLQWVINNQTQLISFDSSGFVQHGLTVTQSLADMLFLLIFVIVAFGIIFRQERFGSTKKLVWVVVWAILTRFGPLAVKVMTDVGNLAINTIMAGNEHLLSQTTNSLIWDALISCAATSITLAGLMVSYAIPVLNLASIGITILDISATAAYILGVSNGASAWLAEQTLYLFSNFIIKGIFQVFASFILSGIYLTYIILFVSRIFMLQILAVLSPLAIMARALTPTEHWFNEWQKSLVSWTFLGVYTLFFLMLGLGSANFIFPKNSDINAGYKIDKLEGLHLDENMYYYLFLIVYLSLVQGMAGKDEVIGRVFRSAMVGVGGAAFTHVVSPGMERIKDKAIAKNFSAVNRNDKLSAAGWGILTKATSTDTMSGVRSMFSGDSNRASSAAQGLSKNWDLGKLSNIDEHVDAKLSEIDKDLDLDKAVKLSNDGKLSDIQRASIFRRFSGKKEYADDLKTITEKDKNKSNAVFDTLIKQERLTPTQIKSAFNNGLVSDTEQVRKAIISLDRGKSYRGKIQALYGGATTDTALQTKQENMLMWALANKEAATKKESLEGIPAEMFSTTATQEDKERLTALLAGADTRIFSNAQKISDSHYDTLTNLIQGMDNGQLNKFAKANPQLLAQMARSTSLSRYLPSGVRAGNRADGEIDFAKLSDITGVNVTARARRAPGAGTGNASGGGTGA